jgi:radical SAM superfamily enzyme YgiQ (UPF0313 family)
LIANRAYARELFTALIPLRLRWFGLATTLLDDDMVALLERSGCSGLLIGFESVSPAALQAVGKTFNRPQHYQRLVELLHAHGILVNGTFVFGGDHDDHDSFAAVRDFVMTAPIDLPRFSLLTPFPGTPLFARLDRDDPILTRDWSLYDGQHAVFAPALMTAPELLAAHEQLWREVYAVPALARRLLGQVGPRCRQWPLLLGANLGYRYYAYRLQSFYTCQGGVA